jgi:glycerol dehydrogenase-like iron-containing ADH family enzyme
MSLRFDPGNLDQFKSQIRAIPGYPAGEDLPIRDMVFGRSSLAHARPTAAGWNGDQAIGRHGSTPMARGGIFACSFARFWKMRVSNLKWSGWNQTARPIVKKLCGLIRWVGQSLTLPNMPAVYQQEQGIQYWLLLCITVTVSVPTSIWLQRSSMESNVPPSRYPDVLICDLETLRDAPRAMTVAGVGDLLAAFGSYADWWLAYRLGLDKTYTEFAQTLMGPLDEIFLEQAEGLRQGTLESTAILAKLIALGGLAMSLSHATAPLSGYEHVISHVLDLIAEQKRRPLAQHGTQVALATILTTSAYQVLFTEFEPAEVNLENCYPTEAQMKARIEDSFHLLDPSGRVAAECWSDYKIKLEAWHAHHADFEDALRDWPEIRAKLGSLVKPPEAVSHILQAVLSPVRFEELSPVPADTEVQFAFRNAPLIRHRFTLADLFVFLNWDQTTLWSQVNKNL